MAYTGFNTEDRLVQATFAEYLDRESAPRMRSFVINSAPYATV